MISKSYLKAKKISTAISNAKKLLENHVSKNGLYENFGQNEVRLIEDKFIDCSKYTTQMNKNRELLQEFNEWCMNY